MKIFVVTLFTSISTATFATSSSFNPDHPAANEINFCEQYLAAVRAARNDEDRFSAADKIERLFTTFLGPIQDEMVESLLESHPSSLEERTRTGYQTIVELLSYLKSNPERVITLKSDPFLFFEPFKKFSARGVNQLNKYLSYLQTLSQQSTDSTKLRLTNEFLSLVNMYSVISSHRERTIITNKHDLRYFSPSYLYTDVAAYLQLKAIGIAYLIEELGVDNVGRSDLLATKLRLLLNYLLLSESLDELTHEQLYTIYDQMITLLNYFNDIGESEVYLVNDKHSVLIRKFASEILLYLVQVVKDAPISSGLKDLSLDRLYSDLVSAKDQFLSNFARSPARPKFDNAYDEGVYFNITLLEVESRVQEFRLDRNDPQYLQFEDDWREYRAAFALTRQHLQGLYSLYDLMCE